MALTTKRKFIKDSMYTYKSDLTPHRINCNGCRFYMAWAKGHGYPCSQCKRNSKNQKRPCIDYFKEDNHGIVMKKIDRKSRIK